MKRPDFRHWRERLLSLPILKQLIAWTERTALPGFKGVPVYDIAVFLSKELQRESIAVRANAVAYSFFLSLFPAVLALLTLLPYLPIQDAVQIQLATLEEILPVAISDVILSTVNDIVLQPRSGLLSVNFLLTLFFASNGMAALLQGFKKSDERFFRKRNPIQMRVVAMQMTLVFGVVFFASVLLALFGNVVVRTLSEHLAVNVGTQTLLSVAHWLILILLAYLSIGIIYRVGSPLLRRRRFFSPGLHVAVWLSLAASGLFTFAVNNFNLYNKVYGTLGTLIAIMLWIQINAFVILAGYELNAAIAVNSDLKYAAESEEQED